MAFDYAAPRIHGEYDHRLGDAASAEHFDCRIFGNTTTVSLEPARRQSV